MKVTRTLHEGQRMVSSVEVEPRERFALLALHSARLVLNHTIADRTNPLERAGAELERTVIDDFMKDIETSSGRVGFYGPALAQLLHGHILAGVAWNASVLAKGGEEEQNRLWSELMDNIDYIDA